MVALDEEGSIELEADDPTPEIRLIEQANREMVQQALEKLPVPFREILLLCEVEEMSYQEVSESLSIPMGTVMSRLSRARKALRRDLLAKGEGARHDL